MSLYDYMSDTLDADETSGSLMVSGSCDMLISGITSGSVKLQALFPGESSFIDIPDASYTGDAFKTIFISEDQVTLRFVGDSNNAGVLVRLARGLTT